MIKKLLLKYFSKKKQHKDKVIQIKFDPADDNLDFDPRGPHYPLRWTSHLNLDNIKSTR